MLETSRLILRPFEERDYADVYEYTNRQTVHCFADMHFRSPEDAGRRCSVGERMLTTILPFA